MLLCGVRTDFADALARLGFHHWLPADRIFLEEKTAANGDASARGPEPGAGELAADDGRAQVLSSTLLAVKRAYELLGDDLCSTCPRRQEREMEKGWYYMI